MGRCHHCGTKITFSKETSKVCDKCGKNPYICRECGAEIDAKREKECPLCKYFYCDECGACGPECNYTILRDILLNDQLKGWTKKRVYDLIKYIAKFLAGNIRRQCPYGINISYAKGRLKNLRMKLQGYGLRSTEDMGAFTNRLEGIARMEQGHKWTINMLRDDGEYGQEIRDGSCISVCFGLVTKQTVEEKNESGRIIKKYDLFTKHKGNLCEHVFPGELAYMICPNDDCGKKYGPEQTHCDSCTYTKGKKRGMPTKLVLRHSNIDFCQLPRKEFIVVKEKEEGDKHELQRDDRRSSQERYGKDGTPLEEDSDKQDGHTDTTP